MRESVAAEQHVVEDADEAPVRRRNLVTLRAERDFLPERSGAGVEHVTFSADGDIHGVGSGHVVRAAAVRAGDVFLVVRDAQRRVRIGLVVIDPERAEVAEVVFPNHAAGVHVARADAVHALDEKASGDDLLGRSVPVAWQHVEIRVAAKPQDAERCLHETVVGFHGVADVAILMRPVRRPRQRAFAEDEQVMLRRAQRSLFERGLLDRVCKFRIARRQDQRAAIRTHGLIHLPENRLVLQRRGRGSTRDDELGKVLRRLERRRRAVMHGRAHAIQSRGIEPAAQRSDFGGIRFHDDKLHRRLVDERLDEIPILGAVAENVCLRILHELQQPARLRDGRRRWLERD